MLGYTVFQIGRSVGQAILAVLLNPVTYVSTALLIWDLLRNVKAERKFFGIRVTRVWKPLFVRYLKSIGVGIVVTVLAVLLGFTVTMWEVAAIAVVSLLLAIIRLRLFATPYPIAVLIFISVIARAEIKYASNTHGFVRTLWQQLAVFHIVGWIGILALAYVAQAVLLWWNRYPAAPALVESKRGRSIGAFVIQLGYVVPMGVLTPGNLPLPHLPLHWPWFGLASGVSLLGLPIVVGFGTTVTTLPWQSAIRRVFRHSLLAVLVLAGTLYAATRSSLNDALIAVLVVLVAQEWFLWQTKYSEARKDPLYVARDQGVLVLCTIKGSVAEQMGLLPGECITHVNHVPVHTEYDLHFALDQNPAYAKLQVVDIRGEMRMVGKPVYAGERHHLGLVAVPERITTCYQGRSFGLFQSLYLHFVRQPVGLKQSIEAQSPPA